MPASASPATTLHRVAVRNDQKRIECRGLRATIRNGKIVIRTELPSELIGGPTTTYTILAADGGDRFRRFDGVKLDTEESISGKKYVFA